MTQNIYNPNRNYDHLIKILLIGDTGVGKSSLLLKYTDDTFTPSYIPTIGIDFKIKLTEMNGVRYKLQLWDTAGQERFRSITTAYYRGAMAIFLVYDVSSKRSFDNINNWMQNVLMHAERDVNLMLIGNKSDREDRVITYDMGKALADHLDIKFMETSAKNNEGIRDAFIEIVKDVYKRLVETNKITNYTQIPLSDTVRLVPDNVNKTDEKKEKFWQKCCHIM